MERPSRSRKPSQRVVSYQEESISAEEALPKRKVKYSYSSNKKTSSSHLSASSSSTKYFVPPTVLPVLPSSVALSRIDKASHVSLSDDQMECIGGEVGFNMIRATHGVHTGAYYWECEVLPPLPLVHISKSDFPACNDKCANYVSSQVRVGWSTRFGELRGPVGYDVHSYGYRDIGGSKVHKRMRDDCYGEAYGVGDVIGCLIDLGLNEQTSEIRFFKNGKDQGQAYGYAQGTIIPKGVYFPAISLFGYARVRANFGPSFIEPIDSDKFKYNAYSDVQPMSAREILEHEEIIKARRKLRKENTPSQVDTTAPAN